MNTPTTCMSISCYARACDGRGALSLARALFIGKARLFSLFSLLCGSFWFFRLYSFSSQRTTRMSDGTLCDACSNFHKRSALYTSSATNKPAKNSSPTTSDVNAHHGTGVFFFGVATGLSFFFVVLFFLFKFFSFLQQRTTPISDGKTCAMHVGACNSLCSPLHSVNPIRLASPPGGMGSPPEGEPCVYILSPNIWNLEICDFFFH